MTKHYIKANEVLTAARNWNKIMNHDPRHMRNKFTTFIGKHDVVPLDHDSGYTTWGYQISELGYNKIKLLASPHHYALLKAFKAKTGWQGQIP